MTSVMMKKRAARTATISHLFSHRVATGVLQSLQLPSSSLGSGTKSVSQFAHSGPSAWSFVK